MEFPERFSNLPEYAWPRLRALLDAHQPGGDPLAMSLGEPRHPMPEFVSAVLAEHSEEFSKYPVNEGRPELLKAISDWIARRYGVTIGADQIIALNGTREGLFAAALMITPEVKNGGRSKVLIPNPFYSVYAVGTIAANAEPVFVSATEKTGFLPDFASLPADVLNQTALAYICSPSNPQGAIADRDYWQKMIALAETYDFKIVADECYAEIYRDMPPPGALEIAAGMGADPERVIVMHSLSKRSNLPGLRSGFAASGPNNIAQLRKLRSYAGAPLPMPVQAVSAAVWNDESHVEANRALYEEKYRIADDILGDVPGYHSPNAGFFLWLNTGDGEASALKLWKETGLRTLPGKYLSWEVDGADPGASYLRVALVAPKNDTIRGLKMLRDCLF